MPPETCSASSWAGFVARRSRAPSESQRRRVLSEAGLDFYCLRGLKFRKLTACDERRFLVGAATPMQCGGHRGARPTPFNRGLVFANNKTFSYFGTTKHSCTLEQQKIHGQKLISGAGTFRDR